MCRRRKIQGPINIHSALGQQLLPILKKSWMIVLVWTVGFDTGADEDSQGIRRSHLGREKQR